MKRFHPLLIGALMIGYAGSAAAVGTLAYLDEANGFRDVQFGKPFDSFSGLDQVEMASPEKPCYVKAGEDLQLGEARLMAIKYCFYQKRLWAIVLDAAGPHNITALEQFLETNYGPGSREVGPVAESNRRLWRGNAVRALFVHLPGDMTAQARLWSTAVESEPPPPEVKTPVKGHTPVGHAHHDPRRPIQRGKTEIRLSVPQRARVGTVVQISLAYRNLNTPARLRILLPRELHATQTVPDAYVGGDDVVVWGDLHAKNGTVKVTAKLDAQTPPGRALLIRADLDDAAGNHKEARETVVLH